MTRRQANGPQARGTGVGAADRSVQVPGVDHLREARELLRAGLRALSREEMSEARDLLGRSVEADPTNPDAHAYLSSALLALADVWGAQRAVDLAMALGPDRFAPRQKAGELALRLGDPERAAEHFLAAMRAAEPGSPSAVAARDALALARRHVRRSIPHRAVLPTWPFRWRSVTGRSRAPRT